MSSTDRSQSTSVSKLYKFPLTSTLSLSRKDDDDLSMDTTDLRSLNDITIFGQRLATNKNFVLQDYGCIQRLYSDRQYTDLEIECKFGATLNKRFHKFVIASSSEALKDKFYTKKSTLSISEDTLYTRSALYECKLWAPRSTSHTTLATLNSKSTTRHLQSLGHSVQTDSSAHYSTQVEKTSIFNHLSQRCADLLVKLLYHISVDLSSLPLNDTIDMLDTAHKYKIIYAIENIFKYLNSIAVTKDNYELLRKVCESYSSDLFYLSHNCQIFSAINSNIFNEMRDIDNEDNRQTNAQNIEVLCGENPEAIKRVKYGPISRRDCTYHRIVGLKNEKENRNQEILLKLLQPICVNHILLRLFDDKLSSYSYYVEVSEDNKNWNRIADYRQYQCRSWQRLYFQSIAIKFVRIVGTDFHHTTDWSYFAVSNIQFFQINSPPKTLNHRLCPNEDIAKQSKGALLLRGVNDYCIVDDNESNFTYHKPYGCIVVQLPQVIIAENLSLKTWSDIKYEFKVWVSIDGKNWKLIFDNENSVTEFKNDHIIEFEAQPILFIKIFGENVDESDENDDTFRLTSLKCPHH